MGKRMFRFALLALIGMTAVLGIATPIIRHFFDVEAAENFLALCSRQRCWSVGHQSSYGAVGMNPVMTS